MQHSYNYIETSLQKLSQLPKEGFDGHAATDCCIAYSKKFVKVIKVILFQFTLYYALGDSNAFIGNTRSVDRLRTSRDVYVRAGLRASRAIITVAPLQRECCTAV